MKKSIILALLVLIALGAGRISAQTNRAASEECATAIIHDRLLRTDRDYKARIEANEARIREIIASQQAQKLSGPNQTQATVYTIPVVVHVIHLGEAVGSGTNISDAQIQSAIDNLTDAYRNQSPYTGVDIEVEFALAQRDPNCNATTGIVRVNGAGVSDYSTNGLTTSGTDNEVTIKALSKWPNTTYYNIWVVAGIDGNMGGAGVQGFAYFPGASSSVDGTVILYNSFGYDPTGTLGYNLKSYTNRNVTTIHELGHAFNLYHSFEGDGSGSTCPTGNQCGSGLGDCCGDIPPHMRSASNCNTSGTNSCDGGSSNTLFVHNFMDYSSDACQTEFTTDQKTRMRAALEGSRGGLLNSLATTAPSGSMPPAACIPVVQNAGNFPLGVYNVTFNTLNVSSGSTNSDGGYVDRTCYYQTTVTAGTSYTMSVYTSTSYSHNVRGYIDYNNDGDFVDAGETVFSSDNVLGTHTGTISIPASGITTGQILRLRVLADYYTSNITSACFNPAYGQAEDFGLTINAASTPPVANFTATPTTLCAGGSVSFTDQSTNTPTSWSWTFQGGSPSTSTSQNPTVTYATAGTYSVSLTATNANGSDTETKTAYITVNALPAVGANASANPVCSGNSTTLSGSGATSYTWTGGVSNGVAFTPTATASYTVTGTDGNGCSNTASITVTVTPNPTVSVSGTMTITSGSSTTITASGANSYNWSPGTGLSATTGSSVVASPTATTAYTVTGTSAGCTDTETFTITVNAVGPTNLQPASCGITLTTLDQTLWCVSVSNATNYRYEVTDQSTGSVYYYTRGNYLTNFQMNWLSSTTYARTYSVRVAAYVNSAWTAYGTSCSITTPPQPTTQLQAAYCGITQTTLDQVLYCSSIVGASNYRYEITDQSNNSVVTYIRGNYLTNFQMNWVSSINYARTYSIRVASSVGGVWMPYGSACIVTTPAFPTTQLQASSCGITETTLNQTLWCNAVVGASNYRYEITDQTSGAVTTFLRGNNLTNLQLDWIASVTYGRTYGIRVVAYVGSTWGSYGASCSVTTPPPPATQLQTSYCNIVQSSTSQVLYCVAVTGATNYRYELTDQTNGSVLYYTRGTSLTNFQMKWVAGVQFSRAYDVRVASYVGGVWLAYGPVCSVTTGASLIHDPGDVELPDAPSTERLFQVTEAFAANLYPNPNDGHAYIQLTRNADVRVMNVLGEVVYDGKLTAGVNELYFLDEKPGMYIIVVSDGIESVKLRMIKE